MTYIRRSKTQKKGQQVEYLDYETSDETEPLAEIDGNINNNNNDNNMHTKGDPTAE